MNGMKPVIVKIENKEVGKLAINQDGLCAFEYSREYLNSGISISPFELPLRSGVFIARPQPFLVALAFLMILFPMAGDF